MEQILLYENVESMVKVMPRIEALYYFVDKNLSDYCQKRYLNKATRSKMQEILEKDREINEEYKNWAKGDND